MVTRDNEMQRLKVPDVEELGQARILGNAGNSALTARRPRTSSRWRTSEATRWSSRSLEILHSVQYRQEQNGLGSRSRLMRNVSMASAIFSGAILLGASTAWAQSPPRKTKSPPEVEQAVNDYNSKIENCRRQAREQKLHFWKRRRFIRDCVNNTH
jgi:hypothetical protein